MMGEGSSWVLLGENGEKNIGNILSIEIDHQAIKPQHLSFNENILSECEKIVVGIGGRRSSERILLPGFRLNSIDSSFWEKSGWKVEDYLPHCGIHPTAVAYGLARELLSRPSAFFVHYNYHAAGRKALVAAITK
jgi:hypothetical protein